MKFILVCVIVFLSFSAYEVLSDPSKDDFCKHKTLEDGKQIRKGSCSKTIQGDIPNAVRMTSTLIVSPNNEAILNANKPFSVNILVAHLETGFFSDPDTQYNIEPQRLNSNGVIQGHTHVTIQELNNDSLPPNSEKFVFFSGLNKKFRLGRLSVDVVRENGTPGLPAGRFRICTMASSFSHQPLVMPVAKRGAQDDCIRITVKAEEGDEVKTEKGGIKTGKGGEGVKTEKGGIKTGKEIKGKGGNKPKGKSL